jgi:hypothetical protein
MVGDLESIASAAQAALPPESTFGEIDAQDADAAPAAQGPARAEPWPTYKIALGYSEWANLYSAVHGEPNQVELVLMHEGRSVGSLRVSCGWIDDPEKLS